MTSAGLPRAPMGPSPWGGDVHEITRSPTQYLALSGGGFRATAHHMGALMAHLRHQQQHKIMTICGVSGGAVAAAGLLLWWQRWSRRPLTGIEALRDFVAPLVELMRANVRRSLVGPLFVPFGGASTLETQFRRRLCGDVELQQLDVLPPLFVFPATDLSSGLPLYFTTLGFTLRPHRLWESQVASRTRARSASDFPLAKAVAASAAFPPVVRPIRLELEREDADEYLRARGVATQAATGKRVWDNVGRGITVGHPLRLHVTDGGVADNLGLRFLLQLFSPYGPVRRPDSELSIRSAFVYDAGLIGSYNPGRFVWRGKLLGRALDIAGSAKEGHLIDLAKQLLGDLNGQFTIARGHPELARDLGVDGDVLYAAANVRTDLDCFTDTEIYVLAYIGYRLGLLSLSHQGLTSGADDDAESDFREITRGLLEPLPKESWGRHLGASGSRIRVLRGLRRLGRNA